MFKVQFISLFSSIFVRKPPPPPECASSSGSAATSTFYAASSCTLSTINSPVRQTFDPREVQHFGQLCEAADDSNVLDVRRIVSRDAPHSQAAREVSAKPEDNSACHEKAGPNPQVTVASSIDIDCSAQDCFPVCTSFKLAEFKATAVIGEGASGKVYLASYRNSDAQLALKVIRKRVHTCQQVLQEQQVLRRIAESGSPFLLALEASAHDDKNFYLATKHHMRDLQFELTRCGKLTRRRATFYAAELVLALEALHGLRIIHRDVKPANILIDATGHLVLADFGMAKIFPLHSDTAPTLDRSPVFDLAAAKGPRVLPHQPYPGGPDDLTDSKHGTIAFSAPEIRIGRAYTYGVDFWSLGIVLYIMLTGRFPFGPMGEHLSLLFAPGEVDEHAERFLAKLLDIDPSARPDICSIKSDPFFASIDWEDMSRRSVPPPFVPHEPTFRRQKNLRIPLGSPYPDAASDPHPDFSFMSAQFADYAPSASGDNQTGCARGAEKKAGFRGLRKIFSSIFRLFKKDRKASAGDEKAETALCAASEKSQTHGRAGPLSRFRAWLR